MPCVKGKSAGTAKAVRLQLQGLRFRCGVFERFRLVDQAQLRGFGEIQLEAAAIFFVEGKINVVPQVRLERRLRKFQVAGRVEADFGEARQTEITGDKKIGGQ